MARLCLGITIALATSGGCTLLVGGQLSDKPSEGSGGEGGAGSTTAAQSSSASQSSSAAQSSSTGWLMCKAGTADCDGYFLNGCEAKLASDANNCGTCKNKCADGSHCKDGKCE